MVRLISKANIEAFNIDTVERAIVFGALCLEIGEQNNLNSPVTSIEIVPNVSREDTYFDISGSFSLETNNYYLSGGLIFPNLAQEDRPVTVGTIWNLIYPWEYLVDPSETLDPPIPDYPSNFNYFEQYLLYYLFIYWASSNGGTFSRNINLDFNSEDNEGIKTQSIDFSIRIPMDFEKWLLGKNYINSVKRTLTNYQIPQITGGNLILGNLTNEILLGNDQLLTN